MAPWKVITQNDKTYLVTRETYYEVLALRPIAEDIEDSERQEVVAALEQHAKFDKATGLTLYPYIDAETGRMIVPGDEHRYHSSENITMAIACIIAEKPWKQYIPFGELALGDVDSEDNESGEQQMEEEEEEEEGQMTVQELRRAKRLARRQIEQARSAFNRRTQGDATANFKTWDDLRNARDDGVDDGDDDDDDSVSWGEIRKEIDSFVGGKKKKSHRKSSSKKSKKRVSFERSSSSSSSEESRFESESGSTSNNSSSSSSEETSSSESSAFDSTTQFSDSGPKKKHNAFDTDTKNTRIVSSDTFDGTDNSNFSRRTRTGASDSRKERSHRSSRKAPRSATDLCEQPNQMQSDVAQELTQQWNAKRKQQKLAEQGEQWQTQSADVAGSSIVSPPVKRPSELGEGTHIPVPLDMYAAAQVIHEGNGIRVLRHPDGRIEKVRLAPSQKQQQQQQAQKESGNDFKSGYGRPGSMPTGIPVINIDMTQVDEEDSDEYDSSDDYGSGNEDLTMYDYNAQTGYLSARPSPEHQQQQKQQVGNTVITQASGELKNMQEYRDRLSTVRNTDRQSRVALNFLEATSAADGNLPIEEGDFNGYAQDDQELKSHPARMALGEEYSPDNVGIYDVDMPREEDCDVLLPTNIEVDPETGRVVRRLDDSLMGLTPKEAARAMKRRRRRAAAGLDAIDASRRTINSVVSGEAYRETLERQKREEEQRAIEAQYLQNGPVQCDEYELVFVENYLEGEGRGCESDAVWNAIVKYIRENSTLHEDKETGERSIDRPAMLPLEEFEQIARGKLSPFTATNVNSWSVKTGGSDSNNRAPNGQPQRKSQIPANESPEQATARLAKEMRAFGMPADMFNAAVQTAKYKDQQGEDEVGEFPQSVDEIMHMAKPFKGKRAAALASKTDDNTEASDAAKQQQERGAVKKGTNESAVVPYAEKKSAIVTTVPVHGGNGIGIHDLVTIQSIMNRQLAAVSAQLGEMATLNQKIDQLLLSHLETTQ